MDSSWQIKIFYCNKYGERIKKLSQRERLSKICMDAGFLSVVEIGQHFMTKDTSDSHNSVQRLVVSTLCQETKNHRNQKVGSSAFFCSSIFHSSKYFFRPSVLPLEYPVITFRLNSSSNSSWFLGLKLGTLFKNSHASFFLAWKRCFSSRRVLQNSRSRTNSTGLLFTSCCLIEASSLLVASTKGLSVSSGTAVLSWARVFDHGRGALKLPAR